MARKQSKAEFHKYPAWSPRFWHGMRFGHWVSLLARNGFRVHPTRWPMAFAVSLISPINSLLNVAQHVVHGRRIAKTEIDEPPVFILGHWRSGTTFLHELMVRDERFTYPTTFQCFAPSHILFTEWFFSRYCGFLMPQRRPMDNMETGWQRPQEDEFALLAMGAPSPYRRIAFPNRQAPDTHWLNTDDVEAGPLQRWKHFLDFYVRLLTYRSQKRVVLKSPPHTGRVKVLAEMFPGARFVHIVRHPYEVFPSTRRLWQSLDQVQGFQIPRIRDQDLDDYIFDCFDRMYSGFHAQRGCLSEDQIIDIRYESLVQDPVGQVEKIYSHLDLGDFEAIRPQIAKHVEEQKGYQANQHELAADVKERIQSQWADYFSRYGFKP